jgi:hypothetical protein
LANSVDYDDPGRKDLRGRVGWHPRILRDVANRRKIFEVSSPLAELDPDGENLVLNVCLSGRHLLVAQTEFEEAYILGISRALRTLRI